MIRLLPIPPSRLLLVCLAPLALGLLSVLLGQDTNWDLRNQHRYNPWALLNGRWTQDLAPAGMQFPLCAIALSLIRQPASAIAPTSASKLMPQICIASLNER